MKKGSCISKQMARPLQTSNSDKNRAPENHKTPITPWTELGTAVILQAVQDLDKVIKNLNSTDDVDTRKRYLDQFNSLKRFFYGDDILMYTTLSGPAIFQEVCKRNRYNSVESHHRKKVIK